MMVSSSSMGTSAFPMHFTYMYYSGWDTHRGAGNASYLSPLTYVCISISISVHSLHKHSGPQGVRGIGSSGLYLGSVHKVLGYMHIDLHCIYSIPEMYRDIGATFVET